MCRTNSCTDCVVSMTSTNYKPSLTVPNNGGLSIPHGPASFGSAPQVSVPFQMPSSPMPQQVQLQAQQPQPQPQPQPQQQLASIPKFDPQSIAPSNQPLFQLTEQLKQQIAQQLNNQIAQQTQSMQNLLSILGQGSNTACSSMPPTSAAHTPMSMPTMNMSAPMGVQAPSGPFLNPQMMPFSLGVQQQQSMEKKRFHCGFCGKNFTGRSGLVRHTRIHTGETPFKCEDCGKCFKQKGTLTSHMRIHTGVIPFQCQKCGTKFRHRGSMNRHSRRCNASAGSITSEGSEQVSVGEKVEFDEN